MKAKPAAITVLDQLRRAKLPDPEPEFHFAKAHGRQWRFDWAWRDVKVALEVEGALFGGRVICVGAGAYEFRRRNGQRFSVPITKGTIVRLGGGHNTGARQVDDMEKYNYAAILGWLVVRVSTTMVRDEQVVPLVRAALWARGMKGVQT